MDADRLLCKAQIKGKPNEWVTGYYFCMHHNDERTHVHHFIIPLNTPLPKDKPIGELQVEIEPETLCQGSGKYDKNGRPIFENDIHSTPYGGLWVVKFGEYNDTDISVGVPAADAWAYGWYMENYERDEQSGFDGNEHEYVNIIGNAIETPELLREQKEAAVAAESPIRLVDAKEVKAKLLRFGFKSSDMTVTEFVEDELTTMVVPTLETTLDTPEEAKQ